MMIIRDTLTALALTFGLVACGGDSGASAAVGHWHLSLDETIAMVQAKMDEQLAEMPAEQRGMAEGMMKGMLDAMKNMEASMEIKADGTLVSEQTDPGGETAKVTGTWTLEGDQITMTSKEDGVSEEQTILGTLAGDQITCDVGDGQQKMTLVFHRHD